MCWQAYLSTYQVLRWITISYKKIYQCIFKDINPLSFSFNKLRSRKHEASIQRKAITARNKVIASYRFFVYRVTCLISLSCSLFSLSLTRKCFQAFLVKMGVKCSGVKYRKRFPLIQDQNRMEQQHSLHFGLPWWFCIVRFVPISYNTKRIFCVVCIGVLFTTMYMLCSAGEGLVTGSFGQESNKPSSSSVWIKCWGRSFCTQKHQRDLTANRRAGPLAFIKHHFYLLRYLKGLICKNLNM